MRTKVLVIGGGAAGMSAALHLDSTDAILVDMAMSNSFLSPWNIMVRPVDELKNKMLKTGNEMANPAMLNAFVARHHETADDLRAYGIPFRESNIGVIPAYERPGFEIKKNLSEKIKEKGTASINGAVKNLLVDDSGAIRGVTVKTLRGENIEIFFDYAILAGGGLSSCYEYSTGEKAVNGTLLALAYAAGLAITNIEFAMFHPFLLVDARLPRILISGDILTKMNFVDEHGRPFLSEEISLALRRNEHHWLFPQMTREFYLQSLKGRIYGELDCDHAWFENFKRENEFGHAFGSRTLNDLKQIEVHPAFHSLIGGVAIDENGRTSQGHIYAAGEIVGGLHGSNRIGGTAVSEAWVFGKIASEDINKRLRANEPRDPQPAPSCHAVGKTGLRAAIKSLVWQTLGPVKNGEKLKQFLDVLRMEADLGSEEKLFKTIAEISLARTASIGSFYRDDLTTAPTAKNSYAQSGKTRFE